MAFITIDLLHDAMFLITIRFASLIHGLYHNRICFITSLLLCILTPALTAGSAEESSPSDVLDTEHGHHGVDRPHQEEEVDPDNDHNSYVLDHSGDDDDDGDLELAHIEEQCARSRGVHTHMHARPSWKASGSDGNHLTMDMGSKIVSGNPCTERKSTFQVHFGVGIFICCSFPVPFFSNFKLPLLSVCSMHLIYSL